LKIEETTKIMAVLKVAYPRYYHGQTTDEAKQAIKLWDSMLKDYTYDLVSKAVKALISIEKFPPAVADVVEKINLITVEPQMSEIEAWGLVKKAMHNSAYHSESEFESLPESIRAAIGNHGVLREWAIAEEEGSETVIASNFMRSYRVKLKQTKELKALPSDVREFMQIASSGFDISKAIEGENHGMYITTSEEESENVDAPILKVEKPEEDSASGNLDETFKRLYEVMGIKK